MYGDTVLILIKQQLEQKYRDPFEVISPAYTASLTLGLCTHSCKGNIQ